MIEIRTMVADDWPRVEAILGQGIATGEATFETRTPTWESFDRGKLASPRLVAHDRGWVVGWVAASAVSARDAYRGVVEHSVYVDEHHRGHGIGAALLGAFVRDADAAGFWTIQASVFPENTASVRLHERFGFRIVGRRERIARSLTGVHAGAWRDTTLIERRSGVNGGD